MDVTALTIGSLARRRAARFGRQHGMATHLELRADGHSLGAIKRAAASGLIFRVGPRVYSNIPGPWSLEARCMAGVLLGGDGALLTGRYAAYLHGVRRYEPRGSIHVLVARRRRAVPGFRFHLTRRLRPADCRHVGPIRCVSLERLVLELASDHTVGDLANVMHEGEFRRTFDASVMSDMLSRDTTVPGIATARAAYGAHLQGSSGTKSELENRVLAGLIARNVPSPAIGIVLDVGADQTLRPDFTWVKDRVCLEVDGAPHSRTRSVREDAVFTRCLTGAGYALARVRWLELDLDFDATLDVLAARIIRLLDTRRRARTQLPIARC